MNQRIPVLLAEYERQSKSPDAEKSSLAFATRQFTTAGEAEQRFEQFKEKLFHIQKWNRESGVSSFVLYDENGNEQGEKQAAVNDFIKITLPGTGKADWVSIAEIYESPDEIVLTVQPSRNPTEKTSDETTTSHFFTNDSTNNFCLERRLEAVNIYVIGLNEKANTGDASNLLESIRNFATANLGHYLGFQKSEWTTFCENFLEIGKAEKQ
jgi:hypothetical protein